MNQRSGISFYGCAALTVVLSLATTLTHAAPVTVTDSNSDFTVTCDNEQTGLFGTPFLSNNTVFFIPNDFIATSLHGDGMASTTESFEMVLTVVTDGFSLDVLDLQTRGDYMLGGNGASVNIGGSMEISSVDQPLAMYSDAIDANEPLNINDGELHNWTATGAINGSEGWAGSQQASLTLTNLLTASTTDFGTSAFVEKKFEGVAITVSNVPVPPAFWMFLSALIPVLLKRRPG